VTGYGIKRINDNPNSDPLGTQREQLNIVEQQKGIQEQLNIHYLNLIFGGLRLWHYTAVKEQALYSGNA
jgi:hypothetical protein